MNIVIGIDPGIHTGIAIFIDGELKKTTTKAFFEIEEFLERFPSSLIVIEDSRLQTNVFTAPNLSPAARLKVARNVGMVDMICKILTSHLERGGYKSITLSPQQKGSKFKTNEALSKATGINNLDCKTQHERDAVALAWRYANATF